MSTAPGGLRERRKQQTREHLSAVATTAFVERGFDQVTIAEVAEAAGVSKMTVTNYFPLKEDLVFDRAPAIVTRLADAVAGRPADASVVDALRRSLAEGIDDGDPTMGHLGPRFAAMVEASPALRAREREMFAEREARLARALGDDFRARMLASQLAGVFDVIYYEGRRRMLAGESEGAPLGRVLAELAIDAFDVVEGGLRL